VAATDRREAEAVALRLRRDAAHASGDSVARALRMAARYIEALIAAGEFDDPRYLRPGAHFEEL